MRNLEQSLALNFFRLVECLLEKSEIFF